jgi:hypothetical protein
MRPYELQNHFHEKYNCKKILLTIVKNMIATYGYGVNERKGVE